MFSQKSQVRMVIQVVFVKLKKGQLPAPSET
jgi:hypothetical protein